MKPLRIAIRATIVLSIITGVIYPLAVTAIAKLMMHTTIDSTLIGQHFTEPNYFWGRPSATTPVANNAAASTGSNAGPLNPDYLKAVQDRITTLHAADTTMTAPVPADLVTCSASGLDPHISPAAAFYQAHRVALSRGLAKQDMDSLVQRHIQPRFLGIIGEPVVNVLQLNVALDGIAH